MKIEKGQAAKRVRITVTLDPKTIELIEQGVRNLSAQRGTKVKTSAFINEILIRTLPAEIQRTKK
tara:strand:+ start:1630 stop:1824 length:195 start_codon:yes stop_codon:yes gene_type:complete